jgi:hypothetical protein
MTSGFYTDYQKADFDREEYIEKYCKIEEDIKDPLKRQIKSERGSVQFPTPAIKKANRSEAIKIEESEDVEMRKEFENKFQRSKDNQEKYRLFCNTIKKAGRVDYEGYLTQSKKQMFVYKLKKFKKFRSKKMAKIRNNPKKYKNKSMGYFLFFFYSFFIIFCDFFFLIIFIRFYDFYKFLIIQILHKMIKETKKRINLTLKHRLFLKKLSYRISNRACSRKNSWKVKLIRNKNGF